VENGLKETFVSQPVALYFKPTAGSQFVPDLNDTAYQWMILPDEPLGVLGVEQNFVLVQRPNGQIGFVPKMLCKDVQLFAPTKTDKVLGAIGWAILGVGWAFWNWLGLFGVLQGLTFLEQSARAFVGIGVILAAMIVLWLSPRKLMARSFAVGIVICYGWMHLLSWGWLTLWQG
jgi:hypothetical protein